MSKGKIHPDTMTSINPDRNGVRMTTTFADQNTYSDNKDARYSVGVNRLNSSSDQQSEFQEYDLSVRNDTERELNDEGRKIYL